MDEWAQEALAKAEAAANGHAYSATNEEWNQLAHSPHPALLLAKIAGNHQLASTVNLSFFQREFERIESELATEEAQADPQQLSSLHQEQQALKAVLQDRYQAELEKEYMLKALEELAALRKAYLKQLNERLEELAKLSEALEPILGQMPGRFWDLSLGHWGLHTALEDIKRYAEFLAQSPDLQRIAEMLGRFSAQSDEVVEANVRVPDIKPGWQPSPAAREEYVGFELGNDLSRLLPAEPARLKHPALKTDFAVRHSERRLHLFAVQGRAITLQEHERSEIQEVSRKKDDEKGPIILCIDTSGSMHGLPETVAKAFALCVVRIALKENRNCFVIGFSTGTMAIDVTDFEKGIPSLLQFLTHSFWGGTDIEPALHEAGRVLAHNNYSNADVCFVTDGLFPITQSIQADVARNRERNTRFYGIIVGCEPSPELTQLLDAVWPVEGFATDNPQGGLGYGTGQFASRLRHL
jgi:uncharacterized protein with von Willebrand factor type A (vWA) domain